MQLAASGREEKRKKGRGRRREGRRGETVCHQRGSFKRPEQWLGVVKKREPKRRLSRGRSWVSRKLERLEEQNNSGRAEAQLKYRK
jgi:hypothetical protein